MTRVLELYNVLAAPSERVWLEVPQRLAATGPYAISAAYETRSPDTAPTANPPADWPLLHLPRVTVQTAETLLASNPSAAFLDTAVAREMDALAHSPSHPARPLLNENFSLLHGHTGPRLLHAAPFLAAGAPVILSLYGYDASRLLRDPAWPARYRWAAAHGATFVVLCNAMRDRLLADGLPGHAIRLIRLGVDLPLWPFRPRPAPPTPRFLFIGRLVEKKGIATLLHAAAALRSRLSFTLDLIGAGPLQADLESLAFSLGLGATVRFLGPQPREALAALIPTYTALILPSQTAPDGDAEGTPIVLMEAQALGLPCITTRHAGNPDVLPPNSPFVVPESDPTALAASMRAVATLSHQERAHLQSESRAHIESHFDLAATVRSYAALYNELLSRA
jgi:glycosyltransferase involved in cell wall biosynthesis